MDYRDNFPIIFPIKQKSPRIDPGVDMDHRQSSRNRALALVDIQSQYNGDTGFMYDISYDGMFIVSNIKMKKFEIVDINLSLPEKEDTSVHFPGMVMHHRKHGFGLMFRGLDSKALKVIDKLLNRRNDGSN